MAEIALATERDKERDRLAKGGFVRSLNFFDIVTPHSVDEAIHVLDHWRRRDPGGSVELTFNSPGGVVIEGFALYDAIQRLRRGGSNVTTRGTGACMSMGAILLQAGDERIMDKNAMLMIHEVSAQFEGKTSTLMDYMGLLTKWQGRALDILSERSTMSRDEIQNKWQRKDWFLESDEALELGFVDRVE